MHIMKGKKSPNNYCIYIISPISIVQKSETNVSNNEVVQQKLGYIMDKEVFLVRFHNLSKREYLTDKEKRKNRLGTKQTTTLHH